ncbi:Deuterolysin metalloprotease family-domain-containing protein [Mycena sp. CBHHK59/15]|nr:Deuterolysin metalloprotease family-domain-containing protein [Mycena sp. CBHHK59/15]
MFFSRLFTLSFTAVVLAGPFKRSNGISVQLTGPSSSVHSISDLTLTAVVTNTGAEDIKVLKYATVLDAELPTRSFTVTRNGTVVPFVGVKLSVSLEEADDSAYTTIPAGESVTLVHDVSALYDFASVGTGPFTFAPVSTFQTAPTTQKIAARSDLVTVEILSSPITIAVTGDVGRREPALNRRSRDICTTASRKTFIDASYTEAKTLASTASSYVTSRGATDTLYRAYFGAIATSRVTSVLNAVANENSSTRTLSCTDTFGVCTAGVIAYTVISTTNIYFCSIFFNEVPSTSLCSGTSVASRNVRGGTTLHELTHATSGTDDVIYGCASDQALSDANSVINADNYNCFTTQVYANTRC